MVDVEGQINHFAEPQGDTDDTISDDLWHSDQLTTIFWNHQEEFYN